MKLSKAFALLNDLHIAIQVALLPTIGAIIRTPFLLFHPIEISRLFMSHVWVAFGDGIDANSSQMKAEVITSNAYGVVLDIGAGHGHTAKYLDRTRVVKYVALEPNTFMHPKIRAMALEAGFTESSGSLIILSCGAQETSLILSGLHGQLPDTIISILTLCSVPDPERTVRTLVHDVLKPGGQFLFYEHVLSHHDNVAWWQRFWTPIWKIAFDGCRLDRPTHIWIDKVGTGENGGAWEDREKLD